MNKYNFQVGDYCLKPTWDRGRKEIAKITKVEDDGEIFVDGCWYDKSSIEPIPITEKWLDLNFERYYPIGEGYPYWRSEDHMLEISTLSNMVGRNYDAECLHKIHLDNEVMETIGGFATCYIHHIQHLCRDCEYVFNPKFK